MAGYDMRREERGGTTFYRSQTLSPAFGASLWEDCPILVIEQDPAVGVKYENDFLTYTHGEGGVEHLESNGGACALDTQTAGHPGVLKLTCDAGDNDYCLVMAEDYVWLPAPGKDLWAEFTIQWTEANTDDANIFVGFTDLTSPETFMAGAGTGPPGDADHMGMFKVEGTTLIWAAENSNETSQTTTTTSTPAVTATWYRIGMRVKYPQIEYFINGVCVAAHKTNLPNDPMAWIFGVMNTTDAEVARIDHLKIVQLR